MDVNITNQNQNVYTSDQTQNQQIANQTQSLQIGDETHGVITRDEKTRLLKDAHNRANENHQNNRRRRRQPQRGSIRLSNTDSLSRANQVRSRLRAKMSEVMSSSLGTSERKALARSVQMQIDRVDKTIRQIRRRERAEREEKRERVSQQMQQESRRVEQQREEIRRRRRNDMRPRSIRIQQGFLYSANNGGFDPNKMFGPGANNSGAAVSFDVAGRRGFVMDTAGTPPATPTTLPGEIVDVKL
ncbi:MAG: hypothetical protein FWC91_00100 [Defluviitaleaceae bacterium]|nr:hypothetical protein [Defluviitaleaceae bacterium]